MEYKLYRHKPNNLNSHSNLFDHIKNVKIQSQLFLVDMKNAVLKKRKKNAVLVHLCASLVIISVPISA